MKKNKFTDALAIAFVINFTFAGVFALLTVLAEAEGSSDCIFFILKFSLITLVILGFLFFISVIFQKEKKNDQR